MEFQLSQLEEKLLVNKKAEFLRVLGEMHKANVALLNSYLRGVDFGAKEEVMAECCNWLSEYFRFMYRNEAIVPSGKTMPPVLEKALLKNATDELLSLVEKIKETGVYDVYP